MARICDIRLVLRKDGHFYYNGRKVKAFYNGEGYGVDVVFRASQVDVDFGDLPPVVYKILKDLDVNFHCFFSAEQFEQLGRKLKESDEKTHELLGRGWGSGPRPYWLLHDFM